MDDHLSTLGEKNKKARRCFGLVVRGIYAHGFTNFTIFHNIIYYDINFFNYLFDSLILLANKH